MGLDARLGLCVFLALTLTIVAPPGAFAEPPIADFVYVPNPPDEGETVVFSAAVSWGGSTGSVDWDFGDGTTSSGSETSVEHVYTSPGPKQVTMSATNGEDEASSPVTHTVEVNGRPSVSFAFSPQAPTSGEPVLFAANATDPEDDSLTGYSWDFGDGSTGTGSGPSHAYATPGLRTVTLSVSDEHGAIGTASLAIDVRTPIVAAPAIEPLDGVTAPSFITPFPVVRLAGEVLGRATVVRLLRVQAPRGSLVRVRCRGKDCPAASMRRRVGGSGRVRFPAFERSLRAGTRLAVLVRRLDEIGKYTRFEVRRGRRPLRTDLCLLPGQRRPVRCSSGN